MRTRLGAWDQVQEFVIAEASGSITGKFGSVYGMPGNGKLFYDTNQIILSIPEPGALALLVLGAVAMLNRRRRK